MKAEDHIENFNESIETIKESIEKGVQKRQRLIGFSTSAGAMDILEAFLHKEQLMNPSSMIKHEWFSSERRANERLNFDFFKKKEIIELIIRIESKRNILCYGKRQPENYVEETVKDFFKLVELIKEAGFNSGEKKNE
jgi:hypothetical protein